MRLKKHVETIKYTLLKSLPPLNDLKRQLGTEQLNDYVQSLCLDEEGSFPYLAKYLRSLSLPLDAKKEILQKEILRALEHPIYFNKISSFVREAWEYYLDDKAEYFKENYLQFLNAEAWLRAEAEHKHGGKRR